MLQLLIILSLFSVLITSQGNTPPMPQSDREAAGFSGRVKTVEVQVGGFLEQDGGWIEQCCNLGYRLTYDVEGKCIAADSQTPPIDGPSSDTPPVELQYDTNGRLARESTYNADRSLRSRTIHKYDDHGNRVETARYNGKGALYHKETFAYSDNRLREQIEYYGENSSLGFKMTYLDYDSQGNWRKRVRSDWSASKGDARWRPFSVTYRSLTYYGE